MSVRPTFYAFEIARSAIALNQKWLDVTGQNLANAETPGYSRQRVVQTAIGAGGMNWQFKLHPKANVGMGVSIDSIQRIRDQFLDRRVRTANSNASAYFIKDDALSQIEEIFNPFVFQGLDGAIASFKKSLENLAENADSLDFMALVRGSADSLASLINNMSREITDVETDQAERLGLMVNAVNQIAVNLVNLDQEIKFQHVLGAHHVSNELLDARDLLLDELSGYGNIKVVEHANGGITVSLGDFVLVDATSKTPNQVALYKDAADPAGTYKFVNAADSTIIDPADPDYDPSGANAAAIDLYSGTVKGLLDLLNGFNLYNNGSPQHSDEKGIPFFKAMLDGFVATFATAFNDLNALGGGDPLFTGMTAKDFRVSQSWFDAVDTIKTMDPSSAGASANEITRRMAAVFGDKLTFDKYGACSIDEYLSSIITELANKVQENQKMLDYTSAQLLAIENQRDAVMAVSINEEGINLAKFQQSYNAAARYMTALDEAVDTIVNRMGIVGR